MANPRHELTNVLATIALPDLLAGEPLPGYMVEAMTENRDRALAALREIAAGSEEAARALEELESRSDDWPAWSLRYDEDVPSPTAPAALHGSPAAQYEDVFLNACIALMDATDALEVQELLKPEETAGEEWLAWRERYDYLAEAKEAARAEAAAIYAEGRRATVIIAQYAATPVIMMPVPVVSLESEIKGGAA